MGSSNGAVAAPIGRDVIAVTGADAVSFLQGQMSQDIAGIAGGSSAWSLLLQPQGKVVAWVRVHRVTEAELLIEVDAGAGDAVLARLSRFKLRVDCDLGRAQPWTCLEVRGADPPIAVPDGALVAPSVWPGQPGFDVLTEHPSLGLPDGVVLDPDEIERRRIVAGVPRMGSELDESVIPAEAGTWLVDASASFTKGCYVGQELVARVESRGSNTPRRLRGVRWSGMLRPADQLTDADGRAVGHVTSAVADATDDESGSIGLAFVSRTVDVPGVAVLHGSTRVDVFEVPVTR